MPDGFDFSNINRPGIYGYWDHMILSSMPPPAEDLYRHGLHLGRAGKKWKNECGRSQGLWYFLANRYKDRPNIIWMIGGDIYGNIKTEVWNMLANTIKSIDKNHLMTFHPFGRHSRQNGSTMPWLDFNMFQWTPPLRTKQRWQKTLLPQGTEEDNWRYVEHSLAQKPLRPVIDGEPSYEAIPKDFTTLRKVSGKTTMYADMLTGRFCRFIRSYVRS